MRSARPQMEVEGPGKLPENREPAVSHPMALDPQDEALVRSIDAPALDPYDALVEVALEPLPAEEDPRTDGWSERWIKGLWIPLRWVACSWLAYVLVFNLSVVRGSSMAPGIHDGDRIVVDEFSYLFTDISRGDIVVLRYPLDPNLDYIKRVVGLPGDLITMVDGKVWINGLLIEEGYTLERDPYTRLVEVVKEGHYFVLGDNRLHSSDSREFGQVPAELVRGKVDLRLWPIERIGLLD